MGSSLEGRHRWHCTESLSCQKEENRHIFTICFQRTHNSLGPDSLSEKVNYKVNSVNWKKKRSYSERQPREPSNLRTKQVFALCLLPIVPPHLFSDCGDTHVTLPYNESPFLKENSACVNNSYRSSLIVSQADNQRQLSEEIFLLMWITWNEMKFHYD